MACAALAVNFSGELLRSLLCAELLEQAVPPAKARGCAGQQTSPRQPLKAIPAKPPEVFSLPRAPIQVINTEQLRGLSMWHSG